MFKYRHENKRRHDVWFDKTEKLTGQCKMREHANRAQHKARRNAIKSLYFLAALFCVASCEGMVGDGSLGLGEGEEGYISLPPEAVSAPLQVNPPKVTPVDLKMLEKKGVNGMRPERPPVDFVGDGTKVQDLTLAPNSSIAETLKQEEANQPRLHPSLLGVFESADESSGGAP